MKTKSTPAGVIEDRVNPMALALTGGATYVARGFAGEVDHLARLIVDGLMHRGFALIDVFQPCPIWNKINTYQWYKERTYKLEENDHDPKDIKAAMVRSQEWGDRIPIGLFYQEDRPIYEDLVPQIEKGPVVKQDIKARNIETLLKQFL